MIPALISLTLGVSMFSASVAGPQPYRLVRLNTPRPGMYGGVACARNGWFGGYTFEREGWGFAGRKATVWKLDGTMKVLHPKGAGNSDINATNGSGFVGDFQPADFNTIHALYWEPDTLQPINLQPSKFPNSHGYAMSSDHQGGVAFSFQLSTAAFWSGTAESFVDLLPEGYESSWVHGMTDDYQVGGVTLPGPNGRGFAIIWYGSKDRYRIIGPADVKISVADGCHGDVQVGYVQGSKPGSRPRACLWRETRESLVDLHPKGPYSRSYALATNGRTQVGVGRVPEAGSVRLHALVWQGSAWNFLDLHETVKDIATDSEALCIDEEGNIGGRIRLRGQAFTIPVVWQPTTPLVSQPR